MKHAIPQWDSNLRPPCHIPRRYELEHGGWKIRVINLIKSFTSILNISNFLSLIMRRSFATTLEIKRSVFFSFIITDLRRNWTWDLRRGSQQRYRLTHRSANYCLNICHKKVCHIWKTNNKIRKIFNSVSYFISSFEFGIFVSSFSIFTFRYELVSFVCDRFNVVSRPDRRINDSYVHNGMIAGKMEWTYFNAALF